MMDFTALENNDRQKADDEDENLHRGCESDEDALSREDGRTRSQFSALTASTMFHRIAPWLEEERPLQPHQEAAILLEYARDGQDLNGSKLTLRSRLCYRLRHKFQWFFRIAAWGLVFVHIFERPIWTYNSDNTDRWSDSFVYPSFDLPYLHPIAVTSLNCFFLSVLWFGVLLEFGYKLGTSYSYLPYISATILTLKSVAEVVVIVKLALHLHPTFSFSPIEAFMCLLVELQYDNNIGYLLRTIPKFAVLMLTLTCYVCIYTALGFLIFNPEEEEVKLYFDTYGNAVWNMLMVLNTSNWPGPMVPAFNYNRLYCMYFYVYIMIMGWGLLNLVLGFNYLFFQQEQQGILEMQESTRVNNRAAAFRLMDVEKKGFLTYVQADNLLKEMYENYEEMSDVPSEAERYELILVLDIQSNLMIDENDFSYIEQKCFQGALRQLRSKKRKFTRFVSANIIRRQAEILNEGRSCGLALRLPCGGRSTSASPNTAHMMRTRRNSVIEQASHYAGNIADPKLLDLYRSIETKQILALSSKRRPTASQWLAYYAMQVDSIYFDILTDSISFALGVAILLYSRVQGLLACYIALSLLEMILKFQVKGLYRYLGSNRNMADGFIAVVLLIVMIVEASAEETTSEKVTHVITKTLVLLRTLLFPRNILVSNGFKKFRSRHRLAFNHAFQSASHFSFLLLVMLVLIYVFAGVGQHAFGGGICRDCPRSAAIESAPYGQAEYYPLNFNDMPSGMVTMFTLLSVNNMHMTASGFVAAYSQWAEVFFACWYALGVLLMLNVLTAVFLDQFTGYMSRLAVERDAAEERKQSLAASRMKLVGDYNHTNGRHDSADIDDVQANTSKLPNAQGSGNSPAAAEVDRLLSQVDDAAPLSPPIKKSASTGSLVRLPGELSPVTTSHWSVDPQLTLAVPNSDSLEVIDAVSPENSPRSLRQRTESADRARGASTRARYHSGSPRGNRSDSVSATAMSSSLALLLKMLSVDETVSFDDANPPSPTHPLPDADLASLHSLHSLGSHSADSRAELARKATPSTPKRLSSEKTRSSSCEKAADGNAINSNSRKGGVQSGSRSRTNTFGAQDGISPVVQNYKTSIFASGADRKKLDEWVASQLPKKHDQQDKSLFAIDSPLRPEGGTMARSPVPVPPPLKAKDVLRTRRRGLSADFLKLQDDWLSDLGYKEEIPRHPGGMAITPPASAGAARRMVRGNSSASENIVENGNESEVSTPVIIRRRSDEGDVLKVDSPAEEKTQEGSEATVRDALALKSKLGFSDPDQAMKGEGVVAGAVQKKEEKYPRQDMWWTGLLGSRELTLIERAAILIQFAKEGHERSVFVTQRARWTFLVRRAWTPVLKVVSWAYALLKFFQRPLWTYYHDRWDESAVYPSSGMPQVSSTIIGAIKLPLLLVLLFGLTLELIYNEFKWKLFFAELTKMRVGRYILFGYGIAQLVMVCYSLGGGPPALMPVTSVGSILYVLWFNRRAMFKLQVVLTVLPRLSGVILATMVFVLTFAALGRYLYNTGNVGANDDLNQEYFGTFGSASWSIFVAITTSNYPNQILPAYRDDRAFFLYFFGFMFIGGFVALNVILVTVFVEFQRAAQLSTDVERASRQVLLIRAYEVLDPTGVGYIERKQVALLLDELYYNYSAFSDLGASDHPSRSILMDILDVDYDGKITVQDFLYFLDVSRIQLTSAEANKTYLEAYFPYVFHSPTFQTLVSVVNYEYANLLFGSVIVVLIAAWLSSNSGALYEGTGNAFAFSVIVVALMWLETFLKILVRGAKVYFSSIRSITDFIISVGSFIGLIGASAYGKFEDVNGYTYLLRIMLMARLFLFPRNIRYIYERSGVRRFNRLVRRILAQTATIGVVFLCITYMFASVGLFAFGGAINKSPVSNPQYDSLMSSRYASAGYFGFNFNDFMSGWFTLFTCLHVSDFDLIVSGFTSTVSQGAKLFFIMWYIAGVLLMLNILKSFFLGEFLSLFLAPGSDEQDNDEEQGSEEGEEGEEGEEQAASSRSVPPGASLFPSGMRAVEVPTSEDDGSVERAHKVRRDGDALSTSVAVAIESSRNPSGGLKKSEKAADSKAKRLLSWSDIGPDNIGSAGDSSPIDGDSNIELMSIRATSGTPRQRGRAPTPADISRTSTPTPGTGTATATGTVSNSSSGNNLYGLGGIGGLSDFGRQISAALSGTSTTPPSADSDSPTNPCGPPPAFSGSIKAIKKIKLMPNDEDEDIHSVSFVTQPRIGPDTTRARKGMGSTNQTRYFASTKNVKNLDAQERKILRKRMNALSAAPTDSALPAVPPLSPPPSPDPTPSFTPPPTPAPAPAPAPVGYFHGVDV